MFLSKVNSGKKEQIKILLYTLDSYNKSSFVNMVQKIGMKNIYFTNDFTECEAILEREEIDLFFLEVDIFIATIQDSIYRFRNHKILRNIPLIFITSDTDYKTHTFAQEIGFESVLIKPFNLESVKQILQNLFEQYDQSKSWYILNSIKKLLEDNQLDIAEKYIKNIEQKINDYYIKYLKALLFYKKKEYQKAIKELKLLLLFKTNMIEAHKLAMDCYLKLEEENHYIESLEKTLELSPKNPEHHFEAGKFYLEKDNITKAEKHLKYVESIIPKTDGLSGALGKLYVKKGDLARAERYFSRADKNAEQYSVKDLNQIGLDYKKQKAYNQALKYFYQAVEILNKNGEKSDKVLFNIASVYFEDGDFEKANYFAKQALQQNPSFKEAQMLLYKIVLEVTLKKNE
ncbi:tetratricopeptide repeat protein [bacterium]|nr:tetratricopeptide repeat protein [bacterium]